MLKKSVFGLFLILVLSAKTKGEECVSLTLNETPCACDSLSKRFLFSVENNVSIDEMQLFTLSMPEEVSLYIDSVVFAKGGKIALPDSFFTEAHSVEVVFPEMKRIIDEKDGNNDETTSGNDRIVLT